jgi:murein tripeptide amidase MpaA
MKRSLIVFFCVAAAVAGEGYYEGHQLWKVTPKTEEQLNVIAQLEDHDFFLNFFAESDTVGMEQSFIVPKEDLKRLGTYLNSAGIEVTVEEENVQSVVNGEDRLNSFLAAATPYVPGVLSSYNFAQYHRLAEIDSFIKTLIAQPRAKQVTELINIGKSTEGRPLNVLKIGKPNGQNKPAFYIHCNTHAREFITAGTCVYIINTIVSLWEADSPIIKPYVEDMDWYILPVHNPDGYEYAHTRQRYWRKTRSKPYGTDPNRNWDARWGGRGSSSRQRSDTYHGPKPFSEPETKAVADFVMTHKDTIKAFIGIHAYSQLWLIPYSYARNTQPSDGAELNAISKKVVAEMKKATGHEYEAGTAANILYSVTGGSIDWAKEKAGIKWSFSPESRPCRFCRGGFNPNPKEIIGNSKELLAGFKVIADRILKDNAANN